MNIKEDKEICISGDLNTHTDNRKDMPVIGKYEEQVTNEQGINV